MTRSEQINELVAALVKAQSKFEPVIKETSNPAFRSLYADLPTIIKATQPALNSEGLVLIQGVECVLESHATMITTLLAHTSGQWISDELHLPATMRDRFDAQAVGSSQTYGRRYAMQAMLGVAGDVDDDANAAVGVGTKEAAQAVATAKIATLEASKPVPPNPPATVAPAARQAPTNGTPEKKPGPDRVIFFSYPFGNGDLCLSGPFCKDGQFIGALIFNFNGVLSTEDETWRIPGNHSIAVFDMFRELNIAYSELDAGNGKQGEVRKSTADLPKITKAAQGKGKATNCYFVELSNGEKMSCWNKNLFQYLVVGKSVDLVTESNDKYINIIGIKRVGELEFLENEPASVESA
jgi:ERF superfamily